jgi:hypothetical protein
MSDGTTFYQLRFSTQLARGRVAVGLLPGAIAVPLARLEPYGMIILLCVLFIVPILGAQMGADLSVVTWVIGTATNAIIDVILEVTGNS